MCPHGVAEQVARAVVRAAAAEAAGVVEHVAQMAAVEVAEAPQTSFPRHSTLLPLLQNRTRTRD